MRDRPSKSERYVYLGQPGYGKCTAASARGFWNACEDMRRVWNHYQPGSLLASGFNQLWAGALNFVHNGRTVDYFAMLHDDIGPELYWLDKLIDELEARDLDVLGVVIPIKDHRGLSSTALDHPGSNWRFSRLSMHDVYDLPETFTSEDLGQPLLLNTGCWVCRFNMDWARLVHFEINDRIVFDVNADGGHGLYKAEVEPEDWFFSRLCHERKLKIGATRKIHALHEGEYEFANYKPWGSHAYDTETRRTSPVPNAFPRDIVGWLLESEGKKLAEWARYRNVLEIGSYCGLSTICMARTAKHVTAVDYWDGRGTPAPQDTLEKFKRNIDRHGLNDKVSTRFPDEDLPLDEYDLVFIDGAHEYECVSADIRRAREVISPDGLIVFHDYKTPMHPGIVEAIDELLGEGGELLEVHETLAVVRPPAAIPLEV